MHRAFILLAVVHLLSEVCSDDAGRQGNADNLEDLPVELEHYGAKARLFLGTSTNTRVVTLTSSTVAVCVTAISASTCSGRKRRSALKNKIKRNIPKIMPLDGTPDLAPSLATRGYDDGKKSGRILFYPATIFTTLTFTSFVDIGRTATVSLACTPSGQNINFCG
ncbi:uncharacterized protein LOC108667202 isoform X2 [Hyalella azteca]|uniref:Uncharacterized protein LOC108667202 isoform X1 n=1 Tax=Hyalella azteca TaxID=294128 RepID=A0A8B7N7S3_HYAAZ|nr:uncharacterized protein LOC108667202 isoform X1 [Hyalella azteca]XP_018009686.1 uncharacterized protein LOC108667202 isoform X2 [Hyalella azteca]